MKFYLDFAHRFHHDELHFMINIADVPNPHALVVRHKRSDWDLSAGDLAICVCKGRCTVDKIGKMSAEWRPKIARKC